MITAGQVRDMAAGEIAQWLPGYTEPGVCGVPEDQEQRPVAIESAHDGVLIVRIDPADWNEEKAQRFRVVLLVEEL